MKTSWDKKFIELCDVIATWSKDKSTQVGAVIVNDRNKILSVGYNGLPIGIDDEVEDRHNRPEKYLWYEHAERNAIYSAAEEGISLKGTKLYCNYLPCPDCTRAIIQSGIKEVMFKHADVNSGKTSESWQHAKIVTMQMFSEAKIRCRRYSEFVYNSCEQKVSITKTEKGIEINEIKN